MIKYYKILESVGSVIFVKNNRDKRCSTEIICHGEDPYKIKNVKMQYYVENKNKKLIGWSAAGFGIISEYVNFEKITEEKFNEILSKFS